MVAIFVWAVRALPLPRRLYAARCPFLYNGVAFYCAAQDADKFHDCCCSGLLLGCLAVRVSTENGMIYVELKFKNHTVRRACITRLAVFPCRSRTLYGLILFSRPIQIYNERFLRPIAANKALSNFSVSLTDCDGTAMICSLWRNQ